MAGAAWTYNAVNTIHPFREGNGRAQRVWLDDLAAGAGWQLDWEQVTGRENDAVSRRAQGGELRVMEAMLDRITAPLDAETAEQRRVQRFAALLRTARPPLREAPGIAATVSPTGPATQPTAAQEHGRDSGYGRDIGYGRDGGYEG